MSIERNINHERIETYLREVGGLTNFKSEVVSESVLKIIDKKGKSMEITALSVFGYMVDDDDNLLLKWDPINEGYEKAIDKAKKIITDRKHGENDQ